MGTARILLLGAALCGLCATPAFAAGFELDEQDIELMGASFAGRAAAYANASIIWWNPGAMTGLEKGWNYNIGLNFIDVTGDFTDAGSTSAAGSPMLGSQTAAGGGLGVVPNLYISKSLGDKWVVGLAINTPFALATDYPENSTVRYHATLSEILVINIEPAVSYRINKQWSIGLGINLEYIEGELGNQLDFGSIGAGLGLSGFIPQALDGGVTVTGDNFGVGITIGTLFELNDKHRFGLSYRSQVDHALTGDADFNVPAGAQEIVDETGAFVDTGAELDVTLPDKLILSGYHQVSQEWAVVWDVSWTNWTHMEEIRIKFDNPAQPDSVLEMDWDASFRFSVGGIWDINDKWTVRIGTAFDQSPVPDSTRGPRLPGNDRFWLSGGVSYRFNKYARLHFSYFHIFVDDAGIDISSTAGGNLVGSNAGSVDAFSFGVTGTF